MSPKNFDPKNEPINQLRRNRQHLTQSDEWNRTFLKTISFCTISTAWDNLPFNNVTLFWYDEPNHRLIFHANISGRIRANLENNPKVCISFQEMGNLLPSNAALEFNIQYRSVVLWGDAAIISDPDQARIALYGLIGKYFPKMQAGVDYRPITEEELRRTSVFEVKITAWSGKENWQDQTDQIDSWPSLSDHILNGGFK